MLQANIPGAAADDTATAQAGSVSVELTQTSSAEQPSGSTFRYALAFSCSTVDLEICLEGGVITIPLDEAADYAVQFPATLPEGALSMEVVDGEIRVTLDTIDSAADGIVIEFFVHSARGVEDGTSWELTPTVTGDGLEPVVGDTVMSTVTAEPVPFDVNKQDSGDRRYYAGQTVVWQIDLVCNGDIDGVEWPESFTIIDQLPPEVEFVSAPGWTYDPDTHQVSRTVPGSLCSSNANSIYEITTRANEDLEIGDSATNTVTATATWFDGTTTDAYADAEILIMERETATGSAQKYVASPLADGVGTSRTTYAGDWLPESHGESRYNVRLATDDEGFTMALTDRFPCLDNETSAGVYESLDSGVCANPAWHLTQVEMYSAQFAGTVPPTVTVTLTDGSVVTLTPTGTSIVRWIIPENLVGTVAQVDVHEYEHASYGNVMFYGYADESLGAGDVLRNRANVHVTHETWGEGSWQTWTPPRADLLIANVPQLGVSKSGRVVDYTNMEWQVEAAVTNPRPITDDLVITDLLPADVAAPFADGDEVTVQIRKGQGVDNAGTWEEVTVRVEVVNDHAGSSRTLIRWILPPELVNDSPDGQDAVILSFQTTFVTEAPYAGDFTNDAAVFLNDPVGTDFLCVRGAQDTDPTDLDGRPNTQKHCAASADVTVLPGPGVSSMRLLKEVKGDLDDDFRRNLAVGNVSSEGGTAEYRLRFENRDHNALNGVVLYDMLPFIGDTGVSQRLATTERGSAFVPEFNGQLTLPAGVTVEYSVSENPCRDEVFPNDANIDCVDDWSSAVPADLSTVRGLKFVSTVSYGYGEGFTVTYGMDAPFVNHGEVAWNSVAAQATDATNGVALPAIEAPKVGISRPGAPDLEIDKVVDLAEAEVGDTLTYTIGVTNVGTLPAFDIVITDQLPANVEFESASDDGIEDDGEVTWAIEQLDAGERATFTVTAIVLEEAEDNTIVNAVGAEGSDSMIDPENPDTPRTPVAATPTPVTVCADDPSLACAVTEVPVSDEPVVEEPGTEEPGTDEPGAEEPGGEDSGNPDDLADTGASSLALLGGAVLAFASLGAALILLSRRQSAPRSARRH